jgi:hypothetical protein
VKAAWVLVSVVVRVVSVAFELEDLENNSKNKINYI